MWAHRVKDRQAKLRERIETTASLVQRGQNGFHPRSPAAMNGHEPLKFESALRIELATRDAAATAVERAAMHSELCSWRAVSGFVLSTLLLFGAAAPAQVMEPPGTFHRHAQVGSPMEPASAPDTQPQPAQPAKPAAATPESRPTPASSAAIHPPSMLDQPAQPAKVELSPGKLTIQADNSSLTAILHQLSTSAGMVVDGLNKDERIFGTYGPGDPREILSALLEGTGYNVVMFGKTNDGTPSQLALSPRGAPIPPGAINGVRNVRQTQEDDEEQPTTQYEEPAPPPPSPQPGPATPAGGVRTPQQMLQELQQMQQMRQQQQQEQQQQPQ